MSEKILDIVKQNFTIIFVTLLALIFGVIMLNANKINSKLSEILATTESSELETYNGATVSGDKVRSAIASGKSSGGTTKMTYIVRTLEDTSGTIYGYGESGTGMTGYYDGGSFSWSPTTSYHGTVSNSTSDDNYINSSANFSSEVLMNKNGVSLGVLFTQDGK
jgi:hypothetical protein